MKTVNIHYAKTHLSRLIKQVIEGEEIVIARANQPVVKLVLLDSARPQRRLGTAKGLFDVSPDFDEPLADFAEHQ